MKKIIVLVLASDTYPSKRNSKAQRNTCFSQQENNCKVYFYKADSRNVFKKDELIFNVSSSEQDIGYKNFEAFKWVLENEEFDYLYRTNTSSYVNLKKLRSYIQTKSNKNKYLYEGVDIILPDKIQNKEIHFVSGAGILFNRDTIQLIVENFEKLDHGFWEDVSIGKLLNQFEIYPTSSFREDIKGNIFNSEICLDHHHYRCRIDNHYSYPRFYEKYVFEELYRRINNIRTNLFLNYYFIFLFEVSKIFYIQQPFWKMYRILRVVLKRLLTKPIYKFIKLILYKQIKKFQLRYFKT